jgi:hypothetical protein
MTSLLLNVKLIRRNAGAALEAEPPTTVFAAGAF